MTSDSIDRLTNISAFVVNSSSCTYDDPGQVSKDRKYTARGIVVVAQSYDYRDYSANVNRWLTRDPIEEILRNKKAKAKNRLNLLYGFANNDALNGVDYLGFIKYNLLVALVDQVTDYFPVPGGTRFKIPNGFYQWYGAAPSVSYPLWDEASKADASSMWFEADILLVALVVDKSKDEKICRPFVYSIEDMGNGSKKGNFNIAGYPSETNKKGISGSLVWETKYITALDRYDIFHFNWPSEDYVYARSFYIKNLNPNNSIKIIVEDHSVGSDEKAIHETTVSIN